MCGSVEVVIEGRKLARSAIAVEAIFQKGWLVNPTDREPSKLIENDRQEGANITDSVNSALVGAGLDETLNLRINT